MTLSKDELIPSLIVASTRWKTSHGAFHDPHELEDMVSPLTTASTPSKPRSKTAAATPETKEKDVPPISPLRRSPRKSGSPPCRAPRTNSKKTSSLQRNRRSPKRSTTPPSPKRSRANHASKGSTRTPPPKKKRKVIADDDEECVYEEDTTDVLTPSTATEKLSTGINDDDDQPASPYLDHDRTTEDDDVIVVAEDLDDSEMIADMNKQSIDKKSAFHRKLIMFEKQRIILRKYERPKVTNILWTEQHFMIPTLSKRGEQALSSTANSRKYPGLMKIQSLKHCCVCMLCFNNPTKDLSSSTLSCMSYNPANLTSHVRRIHADDGLLTMLQKSKAKSKKQRNDGVGGSLAGDGPADDDHDGSAIGISVNGSTSGNSNPFGPSGPFQLNQDPAVTQQLGNQMLYAFMVSCNVAARHGNSPLLKRFLNHVLDKAHYYRKNTMTRNSMCLSRHRYDQQRLRSFTNFVRLVKEQVKSTRQWYTAATKRLRPVPFINVCHDGWDSKDFDMLGVSIQFVVPDTWEKLAFVVGLQRLHSKKSVDVAKHVEKILKRYDINLSDVFRCVNDTASSAVRTGEIISQGRKATGGGTTCVMHSQELCIKHGLGLTVRKKNRQVVDSFPEGKRIRDVAKAFASKVMDKKAKGRFLEYDSIARRTYDKPALKLCIPNDTRVSGCYIMFVSLLRAKNLIHLVEGRSMYSDVYRPHLLSLHDWQTMAEFEAILRSTNLLALQSQMDNPGEIAFSYFNVAACRSRLQAHQRVPWEVIDTTKSWDCNAKRDDIPKIPVYKKDMTETSKKLIDRLVAEFDTYFPNPDSDQQRAMKLHPLMDFSGFRILKQMKDPNFTDDSIKAIDQQLVEFILDFYVDAIFAEIENKKISIRDVRNHAEDNQESQRTVESAGKSLDSTRKMTVSYLKELSTESKNQKATGRKTNESDDGDEELDTEDDFLFGLVDAAEEADELNNDVTDEDVYGCYEEALELKRKTIADEVTEYTRYCQHMDITFVLEIVGNEKYKKDKWYGKLNKKKFQKKIPNYLNAYFDVTKWWKDIGAKSFPHLALAAALVLGKPGHNGYIERTFSKGNYTDGKLQKRRHEANFEMAVLEGMNGERLRINEMYESYLKQGASALGEDEKDESWTASKKVVKARIEDFFKSTVHETNNRAVGDEQKGVSDSAVDIIEVGDDDEVISVDGSDMSSFSDKDKNEEGALDKDAKAGESGGGNLLGMILEPGLAWSDEEWSSDEDDGGKEGDGDSVV